MKWNAATSLAALAFCLVALSPAAAQDATVGTSDVMDEASRGESDTRDERKGEGQDGGSDGVAAVPGQILVVATRIKGQVDSSQPPIAVLDEASIASYGAGSLQELLAALAPQTGSGRGRGDGAPVVLLNGQRISGFRELRNFPTEAIRRVEVLPEEVALRYGYRADQRVVNFILKDTFTSLVSDTELRLPSGGGFSEWEQELTLTKIAGGNRINIAGRVDDASPLTEAERGIRQPVSGRVVSGDPDPARFRTLIADTKSARLNATLARSLGDGAGLSANLLIQRDDSRSLNIAFARPIFTFGDISKYHWTVAPKVYAYLEKTDNSDIPDYRGYVDLLVKFGKPDALELTATLRKGTKRAYGSAQLDATYMIARIFPRVGAFPHVQYFYGYGETLLEYDRNVDSQVRVGLTIVPYGTFFR